MKKILIGSLVGAILTFGWQALSWTVLKGELIDVLASWAFVLYG